HPSIARIYGIEEASGVHFLVLELVEGETLAERLAGGPLPLDEALRVCREVAGALEAAHERGVVHRDLKPGNIKVTPEGKVKVLDFGLGLRQPPVATIDSTALPTEVGSANLTQEGTVLGTPQYMSPEQARGRPMDKRTDIWSFGCVLYETLSGRRAFEADTPSDAIAAILLLEPEWERVPREAPEPIRSLLKRCLEKDVSRRLRDAGDAGLEIETALSAMRGAAAPEPRSRARWRTEEPPPSFLQPRLSQVTFAEAIEEFPAWGPDGGRLAFCREVGESRRLFVKDLGSGEERPLTK